VWTVAAGRAAASLKTKYSYRAIDPIEISDLGGAVETEERGSNEK
jgi:hypothetical protein